MQDFSNGRIRAQEAASEPYQLYHREEQKEAGGDTRSDWDRMLQDFDYFKSLYPEHVKRLQLSVDAVIDEMEYDGSPIYDEFPDRILLEQLIRRADERAGKQASEPEAALEEPKRNGGMENAGIHVSYGPVRNGARLWENGKLYSQEIESRRPWDRTPPPGPRPPWGPPGSRPPWGPPGSRPPWGPPGSRPPWGPPPWGPPPNQRDLLSILLFHELQRRRCRNGRCW